MDDDMTRDDRATSTEVVQRTRAWTGLWVVVAGDAAITLGALVALLRLSLGADAASGSVFVSILTSAFTAVGTMTTAYLGIRAVANTAEGSIGANQTPSVTQPGGVPVLGPSALAPSAAAGAAGN